jgi:hypothetical protein
MGKKQLLIYFLCYTVLFSFLVLAFVFVASLKTVFMAVLFCLVLSCALTVYLFSKAEIAPVKKAVFGLLFYQVLFFVCCGIILESGFGIIEKSHDRLFAGKPRDISEETSRMFPKAVFNSFKDSTSSEAFIGQMRMWYKKSRETIGKWFGTNDEEMKTLMFACLVSHYFAPYGNSTAVTLDKLISEDSLDCDNYCLLAIYIFKNMCHHHVGEVAMVGFDGGAVGNHAQIIYTAGDKSFLLDPTYGIMAPVSFDDLLMGKKVDSSTMIVFTRIWARKFLKELSVATCSAISDGAYRPSDLLYFDTDINHYVSEGEKAGTFVNLIKNFSTPGANRMCKHLSK